MKTESNSGDQQSMLVETHHLNEIKKTIAVLSGKGGVGKSLVTALLAVYLQRTGKYRVGVMDADITGPSMPKLFGAEGFTPRSSSEGIFPVRTHSDIQLMSINLLLDDPDSPVIWRGPILGNVVKQFWTDVIWGDLDFMFLDMPPGTGDVPLTVFQSLPLDGIIIVASPQDLVAMIVKKAINMARKMDIPIIGIIENMSYTICPNCGKEIMLFGESHTEETARQFDIPFLGRIPLDPDLTVLCDQGNIERIHKYYLDEAVATLEKLAGPRASDDDQNIEQQEESETMKIAIATEGNMVSEHFGHCEGFHIYRLSNREVTDKSFLANPGHKPGLLPRLLGEQGVNLVIAGGMGSGAIDLFSENSIDVITGAVGTVEDILKQYLADRLVSTGSVCHEHQHADNCGGH